jgi:hypothetical protein
MGIETLDCEFLEFVEREYGPECRKTIERENAAWTRLSQLGMSLLKSGKKPGSGLPAYKIVTASRLTLDEVEGFANRLADCQCRQARSVGGPR